MKSRSVVLLPVLLLRLLLGLLLAGSALAQRKPFPRQVFTAKTVAILNHTHNDGVEEGALESLKRWGKFAVVDDPDTADIVLSFDKKGDHEGKSTAKDNADGKPPDYSYSMSFGSSITMKATMKGGDAPFYVATTSDSKKKAGITCILDLQNAYLEDH